MTSHRDNDPKTADDARGFIQFKTFRVSSHRAPPLFFKHAQTFSTIFLVSKSGKQRVRSIYEADLATRSFSVMEDGNTNVT